MQTLLMRLTGPMQAWGVQSHFTIRDTGREPSKSGVIGLVCAALGRDRADPVLDLAQLRMGVRVDREGVVRRDYHTAQNVYKASGGTPKETEVSIRYYLADASFLVGLEGDRAVLMQLQHALEHPVWPLWLGRKAFVPGLPVAVPDGVRDQALELALQADLPAGRRVRLVFEDPDGPLTRPDQPISFARGARRFGPRRVRVDYAQGAPDVSLQPDAEPPLTPGAA
jgi:CRISPR system Cascade subunit CasD